MIISIQRTKENHLCTQGHLAAGEMAFCTLEPAFHAVKVAGVTRIPQGQYELKLRTEGGMHEQYLEKFGDWHKGMLWLQDVPDFEDVYIHIGNYPKDTKGCILVGESMGDNAVWNSTSAYRQLYPGVASAILAGENVMVEIRDPQP